MGASVTVDIELITEDILPLQSAALDIHTLSPLSPLSRLQLSSHNSWKSGGRPQLTVYLRRLPVNTVIHTTLVGLEPTTFQLLSDALPVVPPTHRLLCRVSTNLTEQISRRFREGFQEKSKTCLHCFGLLCNVPNLLVCLNIEQKHDMHNMGYVKDKKGDQFLK